MPDQNNNKYPKDKIIRFLDIIADFTQSWLTVTGWVKYLATKIFKKEKLEDEFYSCWVIGWFVVLLSFLLFNANIAIVLFSAYRIWELFIVNMWLFFIKLTVRTSEKSDKSFQSRLAQLLVVQYATVLIGYANIYKYIYQNVPSAWIGVRENTISTWIYYSFSIMTTLGHDEIHPCQNSATLEYCIMSQVFISFILFAMILGSTIGQLKLEREG